MCGEENTKPCLLANYSRDWRQHLRNGTFNVGHLFFVTLIAEIVSDAVEEFGAEDYLFREDDPSKELLTWEA